MTDNVTNDATVFQGIYEGAVFQTRRFVPLRRYVRFGLGVIGSPPMPELLAIATGEMFYDTETGQVGMIAPQKATPLYRLATLDSPWALNALFVDTDEKKYLDPILVAPTRGQLLSEIREGGRLEEFSAYEIGICHFLFASGKELLHDCSEPPFWYPVLHLEDSQAYGHDRRHRKEGLGPINRRIAVFDEGRFDPDAAWASRGTEDGVTIVVTRTMGKGDRLWKVGGIAGGSCANNSLFDFGLCREARNMGFIKMDAPIREIHFAQARMSGDVTDNRSSAVPSGDALAWGFVGTGEFVPGGVFVNIELACEPGRGLLGEESLETHRNRALKVAAKDGRFSLEPIAYVRVTQREATGKQDVGAHISCCPISDIGGGLVGDLTPYPYEEWHLPTAKEREQHTVATWT